MHFQIHIYVHALNAKKEKENYQNIYPMKEKTNKTKTN